MSSTARNVLIILALAAIVAFVPGGGNGGSAIWQVLQILLFGALAWFAVRIYRERRTELYGLGERNRAIFYGAIGLATITLVATTRLWNSGPGTLAWFALLILAGYGVYFVFRAQRQY
jgi:hypothetical protein